MEKFVLKAFKNSALLSSLLALSMTLGCSAVDDDFGAAIDAYTPIQSGFYEMTRSKLEGTGSIRFLQSYGTGHGTSIQLRGSLPHTTSTIEVRFFSDMSLNNGLTLQLKRNNIYVDAAILMGSSVYNLNPPITWANPNSIDIVVEVHRTVSGPHRLLIWGASGSYTLPTALVDTNLPSHITPSLPPTQVSGTQTGLSLYLAEVVRAQLNLPYTL